MPSRARERSSLDVGVDLVAIDEVAAALARFGARYKARLFTAREQADCDARGRAAAASYAARFAAKEAVLKVLAPPDVRPPWTDIEVVRRASGACRVALHGAGRQLARRRRLAAWSVSLSHEAGVAVALVAARRAPAPTKGRAR
ncbi:MAG: 4'-phosphopantetheinyl transferase superfamily protein [Kofleriaceae bacterium]